MPDKAPVILVHGMWSTPDALKELKAAFEEQGYQVYVPSLPYHLPKNQLRGEAEEHLARRVTGFLGHVHEVVESEKGEEREDRGGEDPRYGCLLHGVDLDTGSGRAFGHRTAHLFWYFARPL